ncbi:MAG TPA: flotillin-like FloA family protein, partial [Phycisphaerae bacterium]|nr:flotillin-like FloA family protein [Phycisphaerae bacterium]
MSPIWIAILVVAGFFLLVLFATIGSVFSLWLQALSASADIGIGNLIGMKLRRVDARTIVTAKISL